jgi:hypothetical protein
MSPDNLALLGEDHDLEPTALMKPPSAALVSFCLVMRRTPAEPRLGICRYAVLFLVFVAFSARLFAAEDEDNPWAKISQQFKADNVTLQLTNLEVHVIGDKVNEALSWEKPAIGEYFCAVRNPFAHPKMEDGYFLSDTNYHVLEDYNDFKVSAFPRFSFFTNRPTTIGLLSGHAGADDGSSQILYLVDVETCAHVCIPLSDGVMPVWLQPGVYPPPFALTYVKGIQNVVTWSPGSRPRITQVYSFHAGQYRRDLALERQEMSARFQQVQFSPEDRRTLSTNESPDELDEPLAGRLCDFVHYGKFAGQQATVDRFLKTLQPELRECLAGSRDWVYERNRIDRVDEAEQRAQAGGPAYVYVKPGDTLYDMAQQWQRYGVTVEGLLAANPGIKPERLQVGQKVMLPKKAGGGRQ